jgi:glycosyltransferase involved in cell wall biosynthesis
LLFFLSLSQEKNMKLFIVLSRFPYPLDKGDKLRAYHQIRILSQYHDIYLAALTHQSVSSESLAELEKYCKEIRIFKLNFLTVFWNIILFFFRGLPLQCGYFYSKRIHKKVLRFFNEVKPEHLYSQLIRTGEYTKRLPIKKTLDFQDVFSKGMYRRYKIAPFFLKPIFLMEYKRLLRYENRLFDFYDNKTIITAVDRDLIPHIHSKSIHIIANGVDFESYSYNNQTKNFDLIFTGNMSYAPNVDAAEFIVRHIFPALRETFPTLQLVLCGSTPSSRVQALKKEGVTVTGWVDTIADYYAQSKVFVAPMQIGTGLQNKLLEAMAMKIPCVTSQLAGKPLEGIENGKEIIICSSLTGYIDAISLLLTNAEKYNELAENGYRFVKENYNWEATTKQLMKIMES